MIRKMRRANTLKSKMRKVREERLLQHKNGAVYPRSTWKRVVADYRQMK